MSDVSREVPITNRRGLHARASAKFVTLASSQSKASFLSAFTPTLQAPFVQDPASARVAV